MTLPIEPTEACARALDAADELARFRGRFHLPPDTIYLDGNSLGPLSEDAERCLLETLEEWKSRGVAGWFEGERPWLETAARVGALAAGLVGAAPDQVILSATTTTNIHSLVASLYRPQGRRTKILVDELAFPTDVYALKGQLALGGRDPREDLVVVSSADGRTLDEETIADRFTDEVALAWLPSVVYRSGQLLDMEMLTRRAHAAGVLIGFDCCHSAGAVPHAFDAWGVDCAVWCGYKYLNAGPGGPAFLYVNRRHFAADVPLAGWFGGRPETMFGMAHEFDPRPDAGRWQISTPGILGSSTLYGSLGLFAEAGIDRLRAKSLAMTGYLMALVDEHLAAEPYGFRIGTPRAPERRGGHVAVEHPRAEALCAALVARGVVPDFRPPDVVRICPAPLYGTFHEIWRAVEHLRAIVDGRAHRKG